MGWTNYTRPVEPAEWIPPIDLNLYAKGLQAQQEFAEKNIQDITNSFNNLFSRSAYGPDKRKLKELAEQFKQETASLNLSNLSDINTFSKIKGLINKYSSNPEATAAIKRGSIWDSELEKKQKAEEKGESYTSPALTTLESYFSQDNFYEKPEGLNLSQGWLSPPVQKWMKETREAVKKKVLNTKTGVLEEIIDPTEARDYFMQLASSDPRFQKQLNWDFQQSTKGTDWDTEGQKYINQKIQERKLEINQARLSGDRDGEILATRELERLEKMADPSLVGSSLQSQYFNSWIQNEMDKVGYNMDMVSFQDYKRDPVYMENLRTSNNLMEAKVKAFYDAGIDPSTGRPLTTKTGTVLPPKSSKESSTAGERQKQTVVDAIRKTGKVTQDMVNLLSEKNEYANLYKDQNTGEWKVKISFAQEYDPETGEPIEIIKKPETTISLEDFIRNRTGVNFSFGNVPGKPDVSDESEEGTPQKQTQSTIKIEKP